MTTEIRCARRTTTRNHKCLKAAIYPLRRPRFCTHHFDKSPAPKPKYIPPDREPVLRPADPYLLRYHIATLEKAMTRKRAPK